MVFKNKMRRKKGEKSHSRKRGSAGVATPMPPDYFGSYGGAEFADWSDPTGSGRTDLWSTSGTRQLRGGGGGGDRLATAASCSLFYGEIFSMGLIDILSGFEVETRRGADF